jgi:hypothetical protein
LKIIDIPHIQVITEDDGINSSCQLCSSKAKYKLFNYMHQRKIAGKAM